MGTMLVAFAVVGVTALAVVEHIRRVSLESEFERYKANMAPILEKYQWLQAIMDEHTLRVQEAEGEYLRGTLRQRTKDVSAP
jgi:hypothetical protein